MENNHVNHCSCTLQYVSKRYQLHLKIRIKNLPFALHTLKISCVVEYGTQYTVRKSDNSSVATNMVVFQFISFRLTISIYGKIVKVNVVPVINLNSLQELMRVKLTHSWRLMVESDGFLRW